MINACIAKTLRLGSGSSVIVSHLLLSKTALLSCGLVDFVKQFVKDISTITTTLPLQSFESL